MGVRRPVFCRKNCYVSKHISDSIVPVSNSEICVRGFPNDEWLRN